jgi:hypothetical protein
LQSAGTTAITVNTSQNVGIGSTTPSAFGGFKTLAIGGDSGSSTSGVLQFINNGTEGLRIVEGSTAVEIIENRNIAMTLGTNATERMRLDTSGNLLVGTTSNQGAGVTISGVQGNSFWFSKTTSSAAYNHLVFSNPNGNVGFVQTSGSGTSFLTSSDYRLKENIAPMTGALAKVAQLKPVTYKWKLDGSDGQGFIAHELQEIVPDCVGGAKDAVDADGNPKYQGIDTSFLVATLTAAIQELKAINDTQAETINALTARIVALEGQ